MNTKQSKNKLKNVIIPEIAALGLFAGVNIFTSPAQAVQLVCTTSTPCNLNTLVTDPNNFFIFEDKRFSNFFYSNNGDALPPVGGVNVFGINILGDPSVQFNGGFSGTLAGAADLTFGFIAESLGDPIIGADLLIDNIEPGSIFTDVETIRADTFGGPFLGIITFTEVDTNVKRVFFPPQDKVAIVNDIRARAPGPGFGFSVVVKSVDQHTVPEPSSTLGILALSTLFVGAALMRKQKSA